jgi:DNA polymerase-3 subunit beta
LRNIKLISVFARDHSSIVLCRFNNGELVITPKTDGKEDNSTSQEIQMTGEEQKVAFNYKFVLEFLNNVDAKKIIIEILRPDAPVVFKQEGSPDFIHIIMPVRIQE